MNQRRSRLSGFANVIKRRVFCGFCDHWLRIMFHPGTVFLFSVPAALVVTGILYFLFVTVPLTPWTFLEWVTASEDIVMTGVLVALIPFTVFYAIYSRRHRRIEEAIPDFEDQMASSVWQNMTHARAIELIAVGGKSNMLEEIRLIHRDVVWGSLTSDAIKRFSEHIRIGAIDRMGILVSQAEHFTNNLSQVLQIIAEDAKNMVTLKSERRGDMLLAVCDCGVSGILCVCVCAGDSGGDVPADDDAGRGRYVHGRIRHGDAGGWLRVFH